jgi:hypothetical protein
MSTEFSHSQQLLEAELTTCISAECKTIRDVYNDTKEKSTAESDYWFHPDFIKPLETFLTWFKTQYLDCKISKSEARQVLDKVFSEESE